MEKEWCFGSMVGTLTAVEEVGFGEGTVGFEEGTVGFGVGIVGFGVGTVDFEVGIAGFEVGTVDFEVGIVGFGVGIVGFVESPVVVNYLEVHFVDFGYLVQFVALYQLEYFR